LSEDEGFTQAIIADPDDTSLRLIYADWLDERDDPRGEFLRVEIDLGRMRPKDPGRADLRRRLLELRSRINPCWLAQVDRGPVENCDVGFAARCPRRWEKLRPTDCENLRQCDVCRQGVYHCGSVEAAREHVRLGHFVVVDSRLERQTGDLGLGARVEVKGGLFVMSRPSPRSQRVLNTPLAGPRRCSRGPALSVGETVTIRAGKFRGREGVVERIREPGRVVTVRVTLGGKSMVVQVDRQHLE
jgi:uncharacterized protein (TIGR02996 family)